MTTRDFARYAQIYANKGMAANGRRIFSESWFETIANNPDATSISGSDSRYSYFIVVDSDCAMNDSGYGGQIWYANPATGVVIIQMATSDTPSASLTPEVSAARVQVLKKIDAFLSQ